jgi:hypothetical protein
MLGKPESQFSLTRGALSAVGPAKSNFLSLVSYHFKLGIGSRAAMVAQLLEIGALTAA